jgi:glucokinase
MTESRDVPAEADSDASPDEPKGSALGPDSGDRTVLPLDLRRCALAVTVTTERLSVGLVTALGEIVASQRVPLSAGTDLEFTGSAMIYAVMHAAGTDADALDTLPGIGLSVAHATSTDNLVRTLAERHRLPVRVLDDAAALTVAEHWRGAARGRRNVVGIVVGPTVDGAVLIDGRLVRGTTGNAGRIGHVCVDPFGPVCACGGRGCLTALAGGSAIERWAVEHGHPDPAADVGVIAEAAQRGEQVALATIRRAGEAIGVAAAGVVTLLDLDVVVVGGPVATAGGAPLFDAIDDGYLRHAGLDHARTPRAVRALLGSDAPLLGAAAAVLEPTTYPTLPRAARS